MDPLSPEPETPQSEREALALLHRAHGEEGCGAPEAVVFAPGRVNLIGEHIDYHGGLVLPAAITLGTYIAASRRADGKRRLRSLSDPLVLETDPSADTHSSLTVPRWAMYPLGVIEVMEQEAKLPEGFELTYVSTLPRGMGLSSSASLEVGTGIALAAITGRTIAPKALALMCQQAETRASGVRVGAMDPLSIALGRRGHALLIDCTDISVKPVALPLDQYALVVCDSGKPRSLANGAYNNRREEAEEALASLERATGIAFVARAVTPEVLHAAANRIADPMHRRRLAHMASENGRVAACVAAMEARDMGRVRELFLQSHRSLRYDYEVSTPELDALVEIAREAHPLVAARLTGAGFGGCTVNLVPRAALRFFLREVPARLAARLKTEPLPAVEVEVGDGARRMF